MEMGGGDEKSQNTHDGLGHLELQLPEEAKANECCQHGHQDVDGVTDDDVADAGIGVMVGSEDGKARYVGGDDIRRQQDQRLADAVPALQLSPAAVHTEFWKFVGKHLRLRSP